MKATKIGNAAECAAELEEMDKLLMAAGVTHFTARECFGLRWDKIAHALYPGHGKGKLYAIPPRHAWVGMVDLCRHVAEPLRERLGVPLRVLNGYRPPAYNTAVKGAGTSSHLSAIAFDVTVFDADGDKDHDSKDMAILRGHAADFFVENERDPIGLGFYWGDLHIEWGRRRLTYSGKKAPGLDDRELKAARERKHTAPIDVRECP